MRRVFCLVVLFSAVVLAIPVLAQQQDNHQATTSPLVQLLQSKGILTAEEAAMVNQASSPNEANQRLAQLLLSKGLITQEDYKKTFGASEQPVATNASGGAHLTSAVAHPGNSSAAAGNSNDAWSGSMDKILPGGLEATTDAAFGTIAPSSPGPEAKAPAVVPAFAPVRVLPVGLMGRESVKPVINAGPVRIQPYGFFKMNVIEDSSNPFSGDAPLSGMLVSDTGPNPAPQFHLNARASRFGSNFEWLDSNSKLVVTGKVEADFEGNFERAFNRNITTIRSNQLGLRLAYGRLDYHSSDSFGVFGEFGQNWTIFCSSTLPSSNETTLLGVEFGSCYERDMQARFGVNYNFGGSRHFQIQPEFAIVHPALGANPGGPDAGVSLTNQLNYGERTGADYNRPEYQSRIALQFQLDDAPGVAPAQLIASGMYGRGRSIVLSSAVPAAFKPDFPGGASTSFKTFGYSAEVQLPTRWATLQAKWWAGEALRFYFVDNLLNSFNPTAAFLAANRSGTVLSVADVDAATTVAFGCIVAASAAAPCPAGRASVLPQQPIRAVGGFGDLGIPLSRLFHANPSGRNAGWTLDLGYNIDQSRARDLRQNSGSFNPATGVFSWTGIRYKNDWGRATLNYKLNSWVLIGFEESYYRTRANPASCAPTCSATNPFGSPLIINGVGVRSWHDLHSQISTVFFF